MSSGPLLICRSCSHIFQSPGEGSWPCPSCTSVNVCPALSPGGNPVMVRVDFALFIGFGMGAVAGGAEDGLDGFMMLLKHTHPDRVHPHPEQTVFLGQEEAIKLRDALNGLYPPESIYPTDHDDR